MTEQPIKICLRLDNGDTIRGSVGDAARSARLVGIRQQIEAGELSAEAQKKRLDDIALIYQRLHEPVHAQKRRLEGLQNAAVASASHPSIHARKEPRIARQESKPFTPAPAQPQPKPAAPPVATAPKTTQAPAAQSKPAMRAQAGRMQPQSKRKLKTVLDAVLYADKLKTFHNPVPRAIAPDYYDIVARPMHLKQVKNRLDKNEYEDEVAFKQDMELIFANCLLYNGSQSVVGRYGIDLEQFWLKQWQKSGYAATAPAVISQTKVAEVVAAKAGNMPSQQHPQKQPRANSAATAKQAAPPRVTPKPAPAPATLGPFPEQRSLALFDWLASDTCGERGQGEVVDFLQNLGVQLPQDADGEVELDPDLLDAPTLWQLDRFCQEQSKGVYAPDRAAARPRGPVLAAGPYGDEDTEED